MGQRWLSAKSARQGFQFCERQSTGHNILYSAWPCAKYIKASLIKLGFVVRGQGRALNPANALYNYRCGSLHPSAKDNSAKNCKLNPMTTKEIKSEIHKALDNIPESALQIILEYLKELEGKTADQIKLANNLRDILAEDKDLLERLAK